jgi:hypothetical protein
MRRRDGLRAVAVLDRVCVLTRSGGTLSPAGVSDLGHYRETAGKSESGWLLPKPVACVTIAEERRSRKDADVYWTEGKPHRNRTAPSDRWSDEPRLTSFDETPEDSLRSPFEQSFASSSRLRRDCSEEQALPSLRSLRSRRRPRTPEVEGFTERTLR